MSILKEIMYIRAEERKKKEQISNCCFSDQMIGKKKKSQPNTGILQYIA